MKKRAGSFKGHLGIQYHNSFLGSVFENLLFLDYKSALTFTTSNLLFLKNE